MSLKGTAIPTTRTEILELQPFLKYLADCIRTKKETTEPINAQDFGKEILKISGGANLNIAYGDTPPTDTSKLWLNCQEPSGVEIQNYLGECAVSEVLEYGTIPKLNESYSYGFYESHYSCAYMGNNQIAIVGGNYVGVYDLTTNSYVSSIYNSKIKNCEGNAVYKDDYIYFFNNYREFSKVNVKDGTLTVYGSNDYSYTAGHIAFKSDTEIYVFISMHSNDYNYNYTCIYDIENNTYKQLKRLGGYYANEYFRIGYIRSNGIYVNSKVYNFNISSSNNIKFNFIYDVENNTIDVFTSFYDFMTSLGWTSYEYTSRIYDGERYIYISGGYGTYNGTSTKSDLIIRYDTVNDSFELLDNKLLGAKYNHFSVLVDNRVYMFGGDIWTSNDITYGRKNYIDYFDLKYPLNENNAIVTTNTINTDIMVNLINEDTIKLKSNVASAYIGNADNLAEKVNAYYHDSKAWLGINTSNPFEWGSLQEQNLFLGETLTLEVPLTNNFGWEMIYNATSDLEVSNNSNTLTVNGGSALGTYPITVTATSSEYNSVYEKTFNVITNNAITWSTIADQTSTSSNSITLDLSTYYTNNSSYDVTLSASSSDNTNFEVSITGNTLTVNCLAVANTTITIEAIVLGITYSVSFNLTAS